MAYWRVIVGGLILSLSTITVWSHGYCDPDCSKAKDFEKVVDPLNCTYYYTCFAHEPLSHSIYCGDEYEFDPEGQECIKKGETPCVTICDPGTGRGTCILSCIEGVDIINDPFDCNIYYECEPAGPGEAQHCPEITPHYNSERMKCVHDESVCCVPGCNPNCATFPSFIPDPLNCTQFYLCEAVGEPDEAHKFDCNPDKYFDIPLGYCTSTAMCQTLCPGTTTENPANSVQSTKYLPG